MIRALVVAVTTLAIVAAASAATGWTPKQAASVLASPTVKIYDVAAPSGSAYVTGPLGKGSFPAPQCAGLGKPSQGAYPAFSCSSRSRTYIVRIWSSQSACITTLSLGSCPPALPARALPNDPRACVTSQGFAACVLFAANKAMLQAATSGHDAFGVHCQATGSWTVYTCAWVNDTSGPGAELPKNGAGTVTFTSSPGGWTTRAIASS